MPDALPMQLPLFSPSEIIRSLATININGTNLSNTGLNFVRSMTINIMMTMTVAKKMSTSSKKKQRRRNDTTE